MPDEKRVMVDVGMRGLPFPIRAASKLNPDGQFTVANISISARILHAFEAGWIDKFIQILHQHRDRIGTSTLRVNIVDYLRELNATTVKVDFDYPFFIEKLTPVAKEKCLIRYLCTYSAKLSSIEDKPKIVFKIEVPVVTTYPASAPDRPGGLFGQLSILVIQVESQKDIFPEDLVEIADQHALVPVYSFLTEQDQAFVIERIHSQRMTSVVVVDEIRQALGRNRDISWYSVSSANYGMLHSYSTFVGTEKSMWVPFSGYEAEEI